MTHIQLLVGQLVAFHRALQTADLGSSAIYVLVQSVDLRLQQFFLSVVPRFELFLNHQFASFALNRSANLDVRDSYTLARRRFVYLSAQNYIDHDTPTQKLFVRGISLTQQPFHLCSPLGLHLAFFLVLPQSLLKASHKFLVFGQMCSNELTSLHAEMRGGTAVIGSLELFQHLAQLLP